MGNFLGSIEMTNVPKFPKKAISEYESDAELAEIMKHAKRHGLMDYWWECLHRRCELKRADGKLDKTELERAFNEIMHAYELLKSDTAGRKLPATRIWQKVAKDQSVKPILEKWALSKTKEDGFKFLIANEQYELTGEYLVLQFPNEFSPSRP